MVNYVKSATGIKKEGKMKDTDSSFIYDERVYNWKYYVKKGSITL